MNIVIRDAELEDMDAVMVLARKLATSFVVEGESFKRSFRQILTMTNAQLLVAEKDHQLFGYLLAFEHPAFYSNGDVAWVEEIFVEEQYRKYGVGSALMNRFEQTEKSKDTKLVALATRRAEDFYKSIGYNESATYFKKHL